MINAYVHAYYTRLIGYIRRNLGRFFWSCKSLLGMQIAANRWQLLVVSRQKDGEKALVASKMSIKHSLETSENLQRFFRMSQNRLLEF